ncbi:S41 family peptidase [Thiolapillus brandeum]|uniref:Carboxyl-terminal processing protease n=1 Tax=Thiolapillus brandeum TaxID=1076588 RepID=A0A7U6GGQ6_9GAMM|nr:S41 family peptidase [Thiolapillus brandeum]BAO43288.1 carboxyl-terminal processing protease [Thiolapillus brandeum]
MNKWAAQLIFWMVLSLLSLSVVQGKETPAEKKALPLKELRIFAEIFGRVQQDYVEPVTDRELLDHAIRGMLEGLDPHSAYLDETHFKELQEGTSGEFGGLGIEVGVEDGFIKVIAPIDDTPAQKAGIKAGDLIIRLNERPVKDIGLSEAIKIMRGKPGTSITLTVQREGEHKPLVFNIVRAVIKQASVKARMLAPGFGYVRLAQFQAPTAEDMLAAIRKLEKQNKGPLKGLVLDLRNNPGGVLQGAVAVSDAFLEDGLVVYTQGRAESSALKFHARPGDVLNGAPLVVLVNEGSASASEIVAGALQDHKRAVIMGRTTFGKGSVQTIIPISSKIAIKLTTARYYTPNGRSIQAEGIQPDIELSKVKLKEIKKSLLQVKEADLADHLANPKNAGKSGKGHTNTNGKKKKKLLEEDYELNEALNLLKGITLFSKR